MTPPMTANEVLGLIVVLAFMAAAACVVAVSRLPRALKLLIYSALALRVVGAWVRYTLLFEYYQGLGDAKRYYARGLAYADRFWQLDFSPFFDSSLWISGEKWWGTQFVSFPSGVVLTVIGPSLRGEFLVFSLIAFLGLVGFAVAFRRAYPDIPLARYARWIWLFPSLWYWPSSVGKEAIVLLGLGLVVAGFIGRKERISWLLLTVGIFLVFAIRPQVAAVVILSFVIAYWLSPASRWTVGKVVQGALILGLGLGGIWLSMRYIGVGGFDTEGVQGYMDEMSRRTGGGDSGIDEVDRDLGGVPIALVNILSRPFLWEAHNSMMLFSALEVLGFWGIVWLRRRSLVTVLRRWRSDRFLRLAVAFILVYSISLGMVVANLGIIARQRIFLFPFLFLLIEAMPERQPAPSDAGRLRRRAEPYRRAREVVA